MNRFVLTSIALLIIVVAFASSEAIAQGRGALPSGSRLKDKTDDEISIARARKLRELDAWLRRLPGHFRIDGQVTQSESLASYSSAKVRGAGDCHRLGGGPGVECVINPTWPPFPSGTSVVALSEMFTLSPAALLFGIDTDALGIHYLQVDDRGRAFSHLGYLTDDTLVIGDCPNDSKRVNCLRTYRITAKPDKQLVSIEISFKVSGTFFSFLLHREDPTEDESKR